MGWRGGVRLRGIEEERTGVRRDRANSWCNAKRWGFNRRMYTIRLKIPLWCNEGVWQRKNPPADNLTVSVQTWQHLQQTTWPRSTVVVYMNHINSTFVLNVVCITMCNNPCGPDYLQFPYSPSPVGSSCPDRLQSGGSFLLSWSLHQQRAA